jgi:predicted GNAT family acetyltransferase
MELLEANLGRRGLFASVRYDYELRGLDLPGPHAVSAEARIPGLVIRTPGPGDMEALFSLQMNYEMEEVLPRDGRFNPAACRLGLERLLKTGIILIACLGNSVLGKININARSFTRLQIGGVYVDPAYRNRGVAQALTAALIRRLYPGDKKFTLFVKKANIPACRAYDKAGFVKIADYRISYYLE